MSPDDLERCPAIGRYWYSFYPELTRVSAPWLLAAAALTSSCWRSKTPSEEARPPAVGFMPPPPPQATPEAMGDDAAARAAWTLETDDGGTVRVSYRGAKVMTFHYLFWGKN